MRFYSIGYRELMDMPLRSFWMLNAQVNRLRAEENISKMELAILSSHPTEESIKAVRSHYEQTLGEPTRKSKPKGYVQTDDEVSAEGLRQLRQLKERMVN